MHGEMFASPPENLHIDNLTAGCVTCGKYCMNGNSDVFWKIKLRQKEFCAPRQAKSA
jgi:hypothetical protein